MDSNRNQSVSRLGAHHDGGHSERGPTILYVDLSCYALLCSNLVDEGDCDDLMSLIAMFDEGLLGASWCRVLKSVAIEEEIDSLEQDRVQRDKLLQCYHGNADIVYAVFTSGSEWDEIFTRCQNAGIRVFDCAHIAYAKCSQSTYFLTRRKDLIEKSSRLNLGMKVVTPLGFVEEIAALVLADVRRVRNVHKTIK